MVITGFFLRHATILASAFALLATPCAADAKAPSIDLPATTLDTALLALAQQTGLDIVSTEPGLHQVHTRAIRGRMSPRDALGRLLSRSAYEALPIPGGYRVVARRRRSTPAAAPSENPELVVTGSKQRIVYTRYPGTVTILDTSAARGGEIADSDALLRATPVLQGTALGPGRNKMFVRGIADSSFNGASQATASVYFGDVQLSYSGADPDLKLVDVDSVEILEGPQGTLYGAGAIGGIIRLTPAAPDPSRVLASLSVGASVTAAGSPGYDASGVINLPLTDRLAWRAVAYRESDGGYIENSKLDRAHVNRVDTSGGRLAFRFMPADGWTIDTSGLYQAIDARDAQYAEGSSPLVRASALPQPFTTAIALFRVVVEKRWTSGLEINSTTAVVNDRSHSRFDATRGPNPLSYADDERNVLVTHETRLSRSMSGGASWVIGLALLQNRNAQDRSFVFGQEPPVEIIGVTNLARTASVFGEATRPIVKGLLASAGVRATLSRNDASPNFTPRGGTFVAGQESRRIDPTLALIYTPVPALSVYARYQSGFRSGGLAVARGIGRVAAFTPDNIQMGELGLRYIHSGSRPLTITASYSHANWNHIQSDLFDRRGTPFTANLGTALIDTFEATGKWQPVSGLTARASAVYTENVVHGPLADLSIRANRRLAQTPHFAAVTALDYAWPFSGGRMNVGATFAYTGRAVLGPGDLYDVSHPAYCVVGATAEWNRGPVAITLSGDNLLNARSDRFPFGNPFLITRRDIVTPLRPASVRLGMNYRW